MVFLFVAFQLLFKQTFDRAGNYELFHLQVQLIENYRVCSSH